LKYNISDEGQFRRKTRLTPGQHLIKKKERFPVLQHGKVAHINRETYQLKIEGEVQESTSLSLKELQKLEARIGPFLL